MSVNIPALLMSRSSLDSFLRKVSLKQRTDFRLARFNCMNCTSVLPVSCNTIIRESADTQQPHFLPVTGLRSYMYQRRANGLTPICQHGGGGAYELSMSWPLPLDSCPFQRALMLAIFTYSLFPYLLYIFNGGLGLVLISAGQDYSGAPPGQVQSRGLTDAGVSSCSK